MAHNKNIISSIKLPNGTQYEIHDAQAIHAIEDLGLASALKFKGTKAAESEIFDLTSASVGDVWLCTANGAEYICTKTISETANASSWEKLGDIHDAASSTHTHNVTVAGSNSASAVTGTVTVPTITSSQKYLSATNSAPEVSKTTNSVLGANTTFTVAGGKASTTNVKATATGTAVSADGTASVITGFGAHTTSNALGTDATFKVNGGAASTSKMVTTTINNPSVSSISIPNVTGNSVITASKVATAGSRTNGTAASWTASVSEDGVLSFNWTANTPTTVTLPTFNDVTATNTTLGTALTASRVTTTSTTVATGDLASTGTGASVTTGISAISVAVNDAAPVAAITELGAANKSTVLTGVKVTAQPTVSLATDATAGTGVISVATGVSDISVSASGDNVNAVTNVTVGAPDIILTNNNNNITGSVPVVSGVTLGSATAAVSGTAAAQKWTQDSGSTSAPK